MFKIRDVLQCVKQMKETRRTNEDEGIRFDSMDHIESNEE